MANLGPARLSFTSVQALSLVYGVEEACRGWIPEDGVLQGSAERRDFFGLSSSYIHDVRKERLFREEFIRQPADLFLKVYNFSVCFCSSVGSHNVVGIAFVTAKTLTADVCIKSLAVLKRNVLTSRKLRILARGSGFRSAE